MIYSLVHIQFILLGSALTLLETVVMLVIEMAQKKAIPSRKWTLIAILKNQTTELKILAKNQKISKKEGFYKILEFEFSVYLAFSLH